MLLVLFETFRGNAKYQRARGLGLGLYLTRQIVTALGGRIDVSSTPVGGTTCRVQLPRTAKVSVGTGSWTRAGAAVE